jgi:hypothetical protein
LKNLIVLVTAAAYFAATFLGQKIKLRILCEKLLIISERFHPSASIPWPMESSESSPKPAPIQPNNRRQTCRWNSSSHGKSQNSEETPAK